MSDRELLELAAKAAGIPLSYWEGDDDKPFDENTDSYWNPLTDDGDALRLAVKLGLDVWTFASETQVGWPKSGRTLVEPHGSDPYATTRRAIVRAAAEIGKQL